MSWGLTLNGHHEPDVEDKVRELAVQFVAELKAADVGLTYANFVGATKSGSLLEEETSEPE